MSRETHKNLLILFPGKAMDRINLPLDIVASNALQPCTKLGTALHACQGG